MTFPLLTVIYPFSNKSSQPNLHIGITEVVKRGNAKGMTLDQVYAKSVIKGKASDELHRMLKSGYLARLKPKKEKLY